MKVYRPKVSTKNEPVLVKEEPQDMGDDTDRCVLLDDLKDRIKHLKSKVTHTYGCETQIKETKKCRCDYNKRIELIEESFEGIT